MTQEEQREQALQSIMNMLRDTDFSVEFIVKKNPKGAKIIFELTQEQLEEIMNQTKKGQ